MPDAAPQPAPVTHAASLAVWDVDSPVPAGSRFSIRVGAKCAEGCVLAGGTVAIKDAAGAVRATGTFGMAPLTGTAGLYWTAVELVAPSDVGELEWSAHLDPAPAQGHDHDACAFSFTATPRPDHVVTLRLIEATSALPIAQAHIRVGPSRAVTDSAGIARVGVSKGGHDVQIWKVGYALRPSVIDVSGDVTVDLAAQIAREPDPDDFWKV